MKPDVMTMVQKLSRYLRSHPDACDTPEGIARWWIDADPPPLPVSLVETALAWMASRGAVESLRAADGRVRYRRASAAADLDARLDALVEDPGSVAPLGDDPKLPPSRMH